VNPDRLHMLDHTCTIEYTLMISQAHGLLINIEIMIADKLPIDLL
jgi:hypothetical protein